MNAVEERLRAAMRETADEVTPDGIRPLRLAPGQPGRLSAAHASRGGAWRSLAPVAAALAVIAIAAAALALAGGVRPGQRHAIATGSIPKYYVALNLTGNGDCCRPGLLFAPLTQAVVRATATGNALATITPPRPYGTFIGVTAAADDRTFVLAAQKLARLPLDTSPETGFFLLRIDPASRAPSGRARLTPLPIPVQPPGASDLALSPDATKLAVTGGPLFAPALHVFTLATGAERVWTGASVGPGFGPGAMEGSLSWAADGRTLALISSGVRLLNTAAPGASLLANSRLVVPTPAGPGPYWRQVMISPDGRTIVAVIEMTAPRRSGRGVDVSQKLVTFSARTGKLLHTLNRMPVYGGYEQILWASPSGRVLIVSGTQPGASVGAFNIGPSAGVLSRGRFTPIPWSNRTFAAAW